MNKAMYIKLQEAFIILGYELPEITLVNYDYISIEFDNISINVVKEPKDYIKLVKTIVEFRAKLKCL